MSFLLCISQAVSVNFTSRGSINIFGTVTTSGHGPYFGIGTGGSTGGEGGTYGGSGGKDKCYGTTFSNSNFQVK